MCSDFTIMTIVDGRICHKGGIIVQRSPLSRVIDNQLLNIQPNRVSIFTLTLVLLNKLIPSPLLIFSQSDYLFQVVDTNLNT